MGPPLCEVLGIEHPVVQSGMRRLSGPDLVAEVSNAGGLGILAGVGQAPDDLRQQIHQVRALTSRPFGVNLWLHPAITSPEDPARVSPEVARGALGQLNG